MIDFVGKRYLYLLFSALILIPGILSLAIPPGLRLGIEFTSGTRMTIDFVGEVDQTTLREEMSNQNHPDAIIQRTGDGNFLIRTGLLGEEVRDANGAIVQPGERQQILDALKARFGDFTLLSLDRVSPIVAQEIVQKAAMALVLASVLILFYISYAFRAVNKPFRYGVCAIISLAQEVVLVLGIFSIMGKVFGTEIDSMFITAMLTIVGFAIQDTIVVFDRVRENVRRMAGQDFGRVVNVSLMQTAPRSIITNLTVVLTLVALLLFGGVTIRNFVLVLLIGFVSCTYSSIFIGSQLLVMWEYGELNPSRWFNRGGADGGRTEPVRSRS